VSHEASSDRAGFVIEMSTDQSTTSHLRVAGLRVRCARCGSGDPVLVLHGWGASIEAVRPILAALRDVATAYAVDLPGFGESDPPPEPWSSVEYARFVDALLDALDIDRATVIGHSNGGRVAIRLAVDFPARVDKLVLVNSAGIRPRRTVSRRARVALFKAGKLAARAGGRPGAALHARIARRVASADYLGSGPLRGTLVRLVNEDLRDCLPGIRVPTLLVWGDRDRETPLADGRLMEALIPDAGLVSFPDAGHFSYADAPGSFAKVVRYFVQTESGR
jgi:pimeloyl-ACP methyl ester carboxylesterase